MVPCSHASAGYPPEYPFGEYAHKHRQCHHEAECLHVHAVRTLQRRAMTLKPEGQEESVSAGKASQVQANLAKTVEEASVYIAVAS